MNYKGKEFSFKEEGPRKYTYEIVGGTKGELDCGSPEDAERCVTRIIDMQAMDGGYEHLRGLVKPQEQPHATTAQAPTHKA